jgi:hypothetical protein
MALAVLWCALFYNALTDRNIVTELSAALGTSNEREG